MMSSKEVEAWVDNLGEAFPDSESFRCLGLRTKLRAVCFFARLGEDEKVEKQAAHFLRQMGEKI